MTWAFYHTTNNPTGLSGTVGGAISTTGVAGNLNELFAYVDSPPSGVDTEAVQYRKIHVKNEGTVTLTGVYVWIDAIEHTGQIYIGVEDSAEQSISEPTGSAPTSVSFSQPLSYTEGISLGTFAADAHTGIWLRQTLSGISEPDPYATFRVSIGGIT